MRLRILAVATVLMLGLAGCADDKANESTDAQAGSAGAVQVKQVGKEETIASMVPDYMKQNRTMRVVTDPTYAPMEFRTESGQLTGFDIDLMQALGKVMDVNVEFIPVEFSEVVPSVAAGKVDVGISGMYDTGKRQQSVQMIDYIVSGNSLATHKGNPKKVTSFDALCGLTVTAQGATVFETVLDGYNKDCVAAGKTPIQKITFVRAADAEQHFLSNKADVLVSDPVNLSYVMNQHKDTVEMPAGVINLAPMGIAVHPKNAALADALTQALVYLQDEGVYSQLLAKYNLSEFALTGGLRNAGS